MDLEGNVCSSSVLHCMVVFFVCLKPSTGTELYSPKGNSFFSNVLETLTRLKGFKPPVLTQRLSSVERPCTKTYGNQSRTWTASGVVTDHSCYNFYNNNGRTSWDGAEIGPGKPNSNHLEDVVRRSSECINRWENTGWQRWCQIWFTSRHFVQRFSLLTVPTVNQHGIAFCMMTKKSKTSQLL